MVAGLLFESNSKSFKLTVWVGKIAVLNRVFHRERSPEEGLSIALLHLIVWQKEDCPEEFLLEAKEAKAISRSAGATQVQVCHCSLQVPPLKSTVSTNSA
jgi:hypothetical protein